MRASRGATVLMLAAVVLAGCSSGGKDKTDGEDFSDLGLQADADTGVLRGVVVDEAIRPLAGVLIVALGPDSTNVTMSTKDDGLFGFGSLAPGTYFVTATKPGFGPVQSSAEVVAGDAEPRALRIVLAADPSTAPYVETQHMDGFMTCSVRPMIFALQCGFGQDNDKVNERYVLPTRPAWVQSEMRWESTQAVGDELTFAFRCNPGDDSDPAGLCEEGVVTIVRSEGSTPQIGILNATLIEQWAIGGPGGNPVDINLFAFGRSDLDVWDEQTIDGAQKPVTGNECMQWGLVGQTVLGFDPASCMRLTGPGLVSNQKIDVYTHIFYGYTPPQGWTFGVDGDPPGPPA